MGTNKKPIESNSPTTAIVSFIVLAFSLYFFISLVTYNPSDPPLTIYTNSDQEIINNFGGVFGAYIAYYLIAIFGVPAYLIIFIKIHEVINVLFFRERFNTRKYLRYASSIVLVFCVCMLFDAYFKGFIYPDHPSGGSIGILGYDFLIKYFGEIGSLIFIILFGLGSLSLTFIFSWLNILSFIGKTLTTIFNYSIKIISNFLTQSISFLRKFKQSIKFQINQPRKKTIKKPKAIKTNSARNISEIKKDEEIIQEELAKEIKPDTPRKTSKPSTVYKKTSTSNDLMPNTELLDNALDDGSALSKDELNAMADLLESKLEEFSVDAKVVSVLPGPVITRFEIEPSPGTKASKITNIAQDIARSLAVSSVRVVEVIEGKSVVGIEIPNENRKMVRLSELLSSDTFKKSASPLSLALGHDISGKPVVVDLSRMPHLLVAGTTGSGKSVGINAMLLSLLFKSNPKDVRLILIDPKMLELSVYDGIPHLLTPVITDMTDASNGLRWCVAEMDRRYKLMSDMGVRNLLGFNKKVLEAIKSGKPLLDPLSEEEEVYLEELPSIVVVVDEFADMMMLVGKKVEHLIARIAQKARAAGIHLIMATQRPSVDVITGLIKANIPTRIGFQVSSKIDSRTILDQGGAEQLLGYGDMLYLPAGQGVPIRVHGAFVGDDEVHRVVHDWKSRAEPDYLEEITSDLQETGPIPGWSSSELSGSDEDDELYDEAVNFVIESRRASISAVQRKLRIGYNRAARLIEAMENAGLVSEMSSNGSREVLVPKNQ